MSPSSLVTSNIAINGTFRGKQMAFVGASVAIRVARLLGRWCEPTYCLELMELGQRSQDATDREIASLKAAVWADIGGDE